MKKKKNEPFKLICICCGKCCKETEMELCVNEVSKIEGLGYFRKDFTIIDNGILKLKNIDGHCYFFDVLNKECKIYYNRPLGCRFYPIILNEKSKCKIDEYCSCYEKNKIIQIPKRECEKLKKYIKVLDSEIRNRRK
ncbi:MAG: YkgJ family cysteine cluster protein [Candidatus Helarchaeota archaeon]